MSWPLFNHNYYIDPLGDGTGIGGNTPDTSTTIPPGQTIDAELVYTSPNSANPVSNDRALLATNGDGRAMAFPDGALTTTTAGCAYSNDFGATWTQVASPVGALFYGVTDADYSPEQDRWYAMPHNNGNRIALKFKSDNNGASWEEIPAVAEYGYSYGHAFVLEPGSGKMITHMLGAEAGGVSFERWPHSWTNPPEISDDSTLPDAWTRQSTIFADGYLWVIQDTDGEGTPERIFGVDTFSSYAPDVNTDLNLPIIWNNVRAQGFSKNSGTKAFLPESQHPPGTMRYTVWSQGMSLPAPTIDLDYGAANLAQHADISYNSQRGQFLAAGYDANTKNQLRLLQSFDDGVTWSSTPHLINLPFDMKIAGVFDRGHMQLEHVGDDWWIFCCIDIADNFGKIVRFRLGSGLDAGPGIIDEGQELTEEIVYTGSVSYASNDLLNGLISVAPNGRVMIYADPGAAAYSSNYGASFAAATGTNLSASYYAVESAYDPVNDAWVMSRYAGDQVNRMAYSTDNGEIWAGTGSSGTNNGFSYTSGFTLIGGSIYQVAHGTSTNSYTQRYDFPYPGAASSFAITSQSAALHVGAFSVNNRVYQFRDPIGAGTISQIWEFDPSNFADRGYSSTNMPSSLANWRRMRWEKVGDDVAVWISSRPSTYVLNLTRFTGSYPAPEYPISFGFSSGAQVEQLGLAYIPERNLLLAGACQSSTTATEVRFQQSLDGGVTWSTSPHTLTLSSGFDSQSSGDNERFQLAYVGNDYFLLAYKQGVANTIRYVRFQLTASFPATAPVNTPLTTEIASQAPDIFYKLDDTYDYALERIDGSAPYLASPLYAFAGTSLGATSFTGQDRTTFAMSSNGQKIMISNGDTIAFSSDAGANFALVSTPADKSASDRSQGLVYSDTTDTFYIVWGVVGGQNPVFRSGDNGSSWTKIYEPSTEYLNGHVRYAIETIALISGGRVAIAGYWFGGRSRLTVISDPNGSPSYSTVISPVAFDGVGRSILEAGGNLYVHSADSATQQYYVASDLSGPITALTTTNVAYQSVTDGTWILRFGGSGIGANGNRSLQTIMWINGGTAATLTDTVDAPGECAAETSNYGTVWYGDGKWWLGKVTNSYTQMYVWTSTSPGIAGGFTYVGTINLSSATFNNDSGNTPHYTVTIKQDLANNRWLMSHWDGTAPSKVMYLREFSTYQINNTQQPLTSVRDLGRKGYANTVIGLTPDNPLDGPDTVSGNGLDWDNAYWDSRVFPTAAITPGSVSLETTVSSDGTAGTNFYVPFNFKDSDEYWLEFTRNDVGSWFSDTINHAYFQVGGYFYGNEKPFNSLNAFTYYLPQLFDFWINFYTGASTQPLMALTTGLATENYALTTAGINNGSNKTRIRFYRFADERIAIELYEGNTLLSRKIQAATDETFPVSGIFYFHFHNYERASSVNLTGITTTNGTVSNTSKYPLLGTTAWDETNLGQASLYRSELPRLFYEPPDAVVTQSGKRALLPKVNPEVTTRAYFEFYIYKASLGGGLYLGVATNPAADADALIAASETVMVGQDAADRNNRGLFVGSLNPAVQLNSESTIGVAVDGADVWFSLDGVWDRTPGIDSPNGTLTYTQGADSVILAYVETSPGLRAYNIDLRMSHGECLYDAPAGYSYWNSTVVPPLLPSLLFEQNGIVLDGGTAAKAVATDSAGIRALDVDETSNQHAHLFIFSHDGTASDRFLLGSGDYSESDYGYNLILRSDGTIRYQTPSGNVDDAEVIPASTATMLIVHIDEASQEVTFHYNLDVDNAFTGAPMVNTAVASRLHQTLFGTWEGGDVYTNAAQGVTIDYYAQIPTSNFDVTALRQAAVDAGFLSGPIAVPESPPAPSGGGSATGTGTLMLCHADTAPTRRWRTWSPSGTPPRYVWTIPEEVTPFGSNPYWEFGSWDEGFGANTVDFQDGGKFGGGCLFRPEKSLNEPYLPTTNPYWVGWHQQNWGTRSWTIEAQVKPVGVRCFFFSTMRIWRQGSKYFKYAGITVRMNSFGGQTYFVIQVGKPLSNALRYEPYVPRLSVSPAYIVLGENNREYAYEGVFKVAKSLSNTAYRHVSVCRGPGGAWYVSIDGEIGQLVTSYGNPSAPLITDAALGGSLEWGTGPYTGDYRQNVGQYYGEGVRFDELRVVADSALFTGPYTPPSAPYTL